MKFFSKINKQPWCKVFGIGLLAVLVPFLSASEKSMKALIDDWFETCSVVVTVGELTKLKDNFFIPVELFVQGDPPSSASLVVAASSKSFTKLEYYHDLGGVNRALHPSIPLKNEDSAVKNIAAEITPFRRNLAYTFRVHVPAEHAKNILSGITKYGAFVRFPETVEKEVCRVESMTTFNWLVGRGATSRFGFLLVMVFILSGAIFLIRLGSKDG